jgi:hypothetical protein
VRKILVKLGEILISAKFLNKSSGSEDEEEQESKKVRAHSSLTVLSSRSRPGYQSCQVATNFMFSFPVNFKTNF